MYQFEVYDDISKLMNMVPISELAFWTFIF